VPLDEARAMLSAQAKSRQSPSSHNAPLDPEVDVDDDPQAMLFTQKPRSRKKPRARPSAPTSVTGTPIEQSLPESRRSSISTARRAEEGPDEEMQVDDDIDDY
jgi:hypothetical protein